MTRGGFSDEVSFEQDWNEAKKPDTQRPRGQNVPGGGNRKHTHLEAGLSGSVHRTEEEYTREVITFPTGATPKVILMIIVLHLVVSMI